MFDVTSISYICLLKPDFEAFCRLPTINKALLKDSIGIYSFLLYNILTGEALTYTGASHDLKQRITIGHCYEIDRFTPNPNTKPRQVVHGVLRLPGWTSKHRVHAVFPPKIEP